MQDAFDVHAAPASDAGPLLDFERLDVYRVALEFQALATSIALPSGRRELRDQLDRAALSIVLNTAEGAGRSSAADKARFFTMARGSAMECAAVLDVLRATGLAPRPVCVRGRALLVRVVQMHTRLCLRLKARVPSLVPERVDFVTSCRRYRVILRSHIGLSPTGLSGYPNEEYPVFGGHRMVGAA